MLSELVIKKSGVTLKDLEALGSTKEVSKNLEYEIWETWGDILDLLEHPDEGVKTWVKKVMKRAIDRGVMFEKMTWQDRGWSNFFIKLMSDEEIRTHFLDAYEKWNQNWIGKVGMALSNGILAVKNLNIKRMVAPMVWALGEVYLEHLKQGDEKSLRKNDDVMRALKRVKGWAKDKKAEKEVYLEQIWVKMAEFSPKELDIWLQEVYSPQEIRSKVITVLFKLSEHYEGKDSQIFKVLEHYHEKDWNWRQELEAWGKRPVDSHWSENLSIMRYGPNGKQELLSQFLERYGHFLDVLEGHQSLKSVIQGAAIKEELPAMKQGVKRL